MADHWAVHWRQPTSARCAAVRTGKTVFPQGSAEPTSRILRPRTWSEVVAQDQLVAKVNALRPRGLDLRATDREVVAAEHAIIELDGTARRTAVLNPAWQVATRCTATSARLDSYGDL
jgi:hypothetical protein